MAPSQNERKVKGWKNMCKASLARTSLSTKGLQDDAPQSIGVAGMSTKTGHPYDKAAETAYQNAGTAADDYELVTMNDNGDTIYVNTVYRSILPTGETWNETRFSQQPRNMHPSSMHFIRAEDVAVPKEKDERFGDVSQPADGNGQQEYGLPNDLVGGPLTEGNFPNDMVREAVYQNVASVNHTCDTCGDGAPIYDDATQTALPSRGQTRKAVRVDQPAGNIQPGSTHYGRDDDMVVTKGRDKGERCRDASELADREEREHGAQSILVGGTLTETSHPSDMAPEAVYQNVAHDCEHMDISEDGATI